MIFWRACPQVAKDSDSGRRYCRAGPVQTRTGQAEFLVVCGQITAKHICFEPWVEGLANELALHVDMLEEAGLKVEKALYVWNGGRESSDAASDRRYPAPSGYLYPPTIDQQPWRSRPSHEPSLTVNRSSRSKALKNARRSSQTVNRCVLINKNTTTEFIHDKRNASWTQFTFIMSGNIRMSIVVSGKNISTVGFRKKLIDAHTHVNEPKFHIEEVTEAKRRQYWVSEVNEPISAADAAHAYATVFPGREFSCLAFGHPSLDL